MTHIEINHYNKYLTLSTFIFIIKDYKQPDGCTGRRPLPVVLPDTFMTRLEKDAILPPRKPKLYTCFVGDIFTRGKTNLPDKLLEFLDLYPSIKLICEINPGKFLDTNICCNSSSITTKKHRKVTKLTPHWSSSILKRHNRNVFLGDLCRAERIPSDLKNGKMLIKQKFDNTG